MKVAHSLKLPFPLNWVHMAHLSNCTCSRLARVNFSHIDVFRSRSYSAIHFSTVLRPAQRLLVGGSCSSLDDRPASATWLRHSLMSGHFVCSNSILSRHHKELFRFFLVAGCYFEPCPCVTTCRQSPSNSVIYYLVSFAAF